MRSDYTTTQAARTAFDALLDLAQSEGQFADFETAGMELLMQIGRAVTKQRLEALTPCESFTDEDGKDWTVAVQSRARVMTAFGAVTVERPLFRSERNGPTRCLVKERAPLMAGFWTEKAAKLGALAMAEMPMERAEQFFAEAGTMVVSRSSILRLGGWVSDLWEENRVANEQAVRAMSVIPECAKSVLVSLDGVMVILTNSDRADKKLVARARGAADKGPSGWKEASVGVVSFYDAEGVRLDTWRYARMPEAKKVATKSWVFAELEHIKKARPDLTVVAIADGAADNWTFLGQLGADHEVVDFFHTAEHLHRHVNKANGASTVDTQEKLKEMRRQLLEEPDGAATVFAEMQRLRTKAGTEAPSTVKKKGKRQPTFFDRHYDRMNFAELKKNNLPIGSGVTESTCKLTVCDRLRRTGMRWTPRGGQAIATLRAHQVSGRFDKAWDVLTQANREKLAA